CDCGNIKSVRGGNLISKQVKSCGCLLRGGENHPHWRGGKSYNEDGYVILRMRNGDSIRTIAEHRFIMEKKLGRRLLKTEEVHHINGIRDDNRIENLEL